MLHVGQRVALCSEQADIGFGHAAGGMHIGDTQRASPLVRDAVPDAAIDGLYRSFSEHVREVRSEDYVVGVEGGQSPGADELRLASTPYGVRGPATAVPHKAKTMELSDG